MIVTQTSTRIRISFTGYNCKCQIVRNSLLQSELDFSCFHMSQIRALPPAYCQNCRRSIRVYHCRSGDQLRRQRPFRRRRRC